MWEDVHGFIAEDPTFTEFTRFELGRTSSYRVVALVPTELMEEDPNLYGETLDALTFTLDQIST